MDIAIVSINEMEKPGSQILGNAENGRATLPAPTAAPLFPAVEIPPAVVEEVAGYKGSGVIFDDQARPVAIHPQAPRCLGNDEYRTARHVYQRQKCATCRPAVNSACMKVIRCLLRHDADLASHRVRYMNRQGGATKTASPQHRSAYQHHWRRASNASGYDSGLDAVRLETERRLQDRAANNRAERARRRYRELAGKPLLTQTEINKALMKESLDVAELAGRVEELGVGDVPAALLKWYWKNCDEFIAVATAMNVAKVVEGSESAKPSVVRDILYPEVAGAAMTPAERARLTRTIAKVEALMAAAAAA